ncbi:MAG: hypothetical protein CMI31_08755 [Opitutae bacterium]|nr:hypothetical protein [Opitutae bacterium]|tara:strand:+ start:378 stop:635 length:258 start_codon:yes stop_codon:yes gene_type:complete
MEAVSELWEQLQAHPLLLWVAGVLALFLMVGIVKRVLTIAVLSGVLLLLYFVYVTNFQERFPLPEFDLDEMRERWLPADEDANAS